MLKPSLLLLLFSTLSFSQIDLMSNEYPTNPGGNPFYPDATINLFSCLTGSAVGVNGVPIGLTYRTYKGWGAHVHEVGGSVRPGVVIFNPATQLTGTGGNPPGCVSWQVEFNHFAGGYTFTAQSPGFPVRGINYITRQYTAVSGQPLYFQEYRGDLFPPAPGALVGGPYNKPYGYDPRHLVVGFGNQSQFVGSSHWISQDVYNRVVNFSGYYKVDTGGDLLAITRISLPDGGIYDNDVYGVTPGAPNNLEWQTRVFEEHARGTEIDVIVPSTTLRQNIAFAAITTAGCQIGLYTPDGAAIGTQTQMENYWRNAGVMHVTCKPGHSLKGTGHGPAQ